MNTFTIYIYIILAVALLLLAINFIFATHNPYMEKKTAFECGFHSFLGQNRKEFNISFFLFGLIFLIFDLEILLVYPYVLSAYMNNTYGLIIMLIFFTLLTVGFVFEIGKKALSIKSRQNLYDSMLI
jgi:NADH-ubiquinone oxidoreductase chain 3